MTFHNDEIHAISSHINNLTVDKLRKDLIKIFKVNDGLTITVDFLDVTLYPNIIKYYRFMTPNENIEYIHKSSNEFPALIRKLIPGISKQLI